MISRAEYAGAGKHVLDKLSTKPTDRHLGTVFTRCLGEIRKDRYFYHAGDMPSSPPPADEEVDSEDDGNGARARVGTSADEEVDSEDDGNGARARVGTLEGQRPKGLRVKWAGTPMVADVRHHLGQRTSSR